VGLEFELKFASLNTCKTGILLFFFLKACTFIELLHPHFIPFQADRESKSFSFIHLKLRKTKGGSMRTDHSK
jgi:hypothetical protein